MSNKDRCYYGTDVCEGELWQCQSCGEMFCQTHSHHTEKGSNVECVSCERERLENEAEAGRISPAESLTAASTLQELLAAGCTVVLPSRQELRGNTARGTVENLSETTPSALISTRRFGSHQLTADGVNDALKLASTTAKFKVL